jgi:hypothetical protein
MKPDLHWREKKSFGGCKFYNKQYVLFDILIDDFFYRCAFQKTFHFAETRDAVSDHIIIFFLCHG